MRDDNRNDASNPPFAAAISGWVARNDAGIEIAQTTGRASMMFPMKAVARL